MKSLKRHRSGLIAHLAVVVLLSACATPSGAQLSRSKTYAGVDVGATFDASRFSVRSGVGLSVGGLLGRQFVPRAAAELRFGFERFAAPTQFISPGGCFGAVPCDPPSPERVQITTLALDAVVSESIDRSGPFLVVGAGGRYVDAQPGRSQLRPYVELGTGLGIPIGGPRMSVEVRYQLAISDPDLPSWTLPLALAVRF